MVVAEVEVAINEFASAVSDTFAAVARTEVVAELFVVTVVVPEIAVEIEVDAVLLRTVVRAFVVVAIAVVVVAVTIVAVVVVVVVRVDGTQEAVVAVVVLFTMRLRL